MAKSTHKKKMRFERICLAALFVVGCFYLFSNLSMNSMEAALTVEIQRTQEELDELQSDIDGLNTARQEKLSFDNIREVAKSQGYSLNYANTNTASTNQSEQTTENE